MNERLKQLRLSLDLTQEEFGSRIHVQKGHISSMEKGVRNIIDRTIIDICREFNVNEEWLRTGEGEMFNKRSETLFELLAEKIDTLSETDKKAIMIYIELEPEYRKMLHDIVKKMAT